MDCCFSFNRIRSRLDVSCSWYLLSGAFLLLLGTQNALGDDKFNPEGSPGPLVICGGGLLPTEIREKFVELAGGKHAKLVIVPTANPRTDRDQNFDLFLEPWLHYELSTIDVIHANSREEAGQANFSRILQEATGVWISGGNQSRLADRYLDTEVEAEIRAVRGRGGVVGGTSAGAAIMSRVMIADGFARPQIETGFDLFPDAIIDQHFSQRNRWQRLVAAMKTNPHRVGVGIDEQTALVVLGRRAEVMGRGKVLMHLSADDSGHPLVREFSPGEALDITSWRRAARNAVVQQYPLPSPQSPRVASGSLVFTGGGEVPDSVARRVMDLAGGPDAPIVILQAGEPNAQTQTHDDPFAQALQPFGPKRVVFVQPKNKSDVDQPETLELLREARAVWFGSGEKWRWIDLYEGTQALPLIRQVLERGGVVGANAEAASLQSEMLMRANPLGSPETVALGYERGFGFLPGTAVDRHFGEKKGFDELLSVMKRYPQMMGVGIDESTALIVSGSTGQVHGKGNVHFCNTGNSNNTSTQELNVKSPVVADEPLVWQRVANGESYDFQNRRLVEIVTVDPGQR